MIFDRTSPDATRSNNNGNVDTYNFCRILFETFPEHNFCIIGRSDYGSLSEDSRWPNVVAWAENEKSVEEFVPDAGFIIGGLTQYDAGYRPIDCPVVNYLNNHDVAWWMISTDPRCFCSDPGLKSQPVGIYSMGKYHTSIAGYCMDVECMPEILSMTCYKADAKPAQKNMNCIIATSDSTTYPRVDIILKLIGNKNISIYGRCAKFTEGQDKRFKGEIPIRLMHNLYKASKMTVLTPILEGWFTGKIAESMMYDMVPIFNSDYGFDCLTSCSDLKRLLLCDSEEGFSKRYKLFSKDPGARAYVLQELKKNIGYDALVNGSAMHDFIEKKLSTVSGCKI